MTKEQILESLKPCMLVDPKVGDKVYSITRLEWETIVDIDLGEDYSILTSADETFTINGHSLKKDITPTIYKSNPFEALLKSNQERVVLVCDFDGQKPKRRVLIKELPNELALCWSGAERIEDVNYNGATTTWNHFKELPSTTPTLEELKQAYADAKGLNINEIIY